MAIEKVERNAPAIPQRPPPPEPSDSGMSPFNAPVDRGPEVVATTLAPQLGSNAQYLGKGDFDMRKLSVIEEQDIPFLIYAAIRGKKNLTWQLIYDQYLNLQVSVAGRGRKDIIRMEGVSKGGLPDYPPDNEKPGWLSRNLTDREWKKRAKEDMM